VQKVFLWDLAVSKFHRLHTDGQTDRRTTTMPIAQPSLKYGQLKIRARWSKTSDHASEWPNT